MLWGSILSYPEQISVFNPNSGITLAQIETELKKSDKEIAAHARTALKIELAELEALQKLPEKHEHYQLLSKKGIKKTAHGLKLKIAHLYKKLLLEKASDELLAKLRREHLLKLKEELQPKKTTIAAK